MANSARSAKKLRACLERRCLGLRTFSVVFSSFKRAPFRQMASGDVTSPHQAGDGLTWRDISSQLKSSRHTGALNVYEKSAPHYRTAAAAAAAAVMSPRRLVLSWSFLAGRSERVGLSGVVSAAQCVPVAAPGCHRRLHHRSSRPRPYLDDHTTESASRCDVSAVGATDGRSGVAADRRG